MVSLSRVHFVGGICREDGGRAKGGVGSLESSNSGWLYTNPPNSQGPFFFNVKTRLFIWVPGNFSCGWISSRQIFGEVLESFCELK